MHWFVALVALVALGSSKAHTEGAASRQWVVAPDTVRALSLARSPQMSLGVSGAPGGRPARKGSLSSRLRSQLARLGRIGGRTWRAPSPSGPSDRLGHGSDSSLRIGGSGRDISSRLHLAAVMSGGGVSQALKKDGTRKKRVLFLISDTGGGHRASAEAIQSALDELYPGQLQCDIVDIWTQHGGWPFNTCVKGYQFLAKRRFMWWLTWHYSVLWPTRTGTTLWAKSAGVVGRFRACLEKFEPDLVVSMHPLTQELPMEALKKMGGGKRRVPFCTVVTDLGSAHPHWFDKRVDFCFVPSEELRRAARFRGLHDRQIRLYGLPIRSTFWQTPKSKVVTRRALGLNGWDTALVVGGGDGVGGLEAIIQALADEGRKRGIPTQIVAVCGRNAALENRLKAKTWPSGVRVEVLGFISQMSDYMAAADVLVTKAGPGTIVEASARGLPIVLSSFLPGQEAGNVPYVVRNGFGAFRRRPENIARTVMDWIVDPIKMADLSRSALAVARPLATYQIADDIGAMIVGRNSQLMPRLDAVAAGNTYPAVPVP
mmetsp:Transcript_5663/g.13512  ORF Transcript_5663/g.13512 Transcript_5663/m.13512 type:complete len:543 (+) Transcript_5663:1269-2897(+)